MFSEDFAFKCLEEWNRHRVKERVMTETVNGYRVEVMGTGEPDEYHALVHHPTTGALAFDTGRDAHPGAMRRSFDRATAWCRARRNPTLIGAIND